MEKQNSSTSWNDWYDSPGTWQPPNLIYESTSPDAPYCTNCGSLIEKTCHIYCPYCGTQLKPDVCPHCGKQI